MPYIETTSNVSIPGRKEQVIKDRRRAMKKPRQDGKLADAVFPRQCRNVLQGHGRPRANRQVKLFGGSATEEDYAALTEALTDILREELDIDSDRIYVTYEEIGFWGWNGGNL